ncbi:MAG TPA: hypothetical protein PK816_09820 [Candidatus Cloacimonadota bacterium]|nr:hypothetical protein [Candidatus Cloacimonadota bacterium]
MAKFKSRYRDLSVLVNGVKIQFENHEFKTNDPKLIDYLKKNQGADYTCISDNSEKQNINSLRVQARDANFPGDVDKASKDDLIQFLESLK